jgi:hypothetical protein
MNSFLLFNSFILEEQSSIYLRSEPMAVANALRLYLKESGLNLFKYNQGS